MNIQQEKTMLALRPIIPQAQVNDDTFNIEAFQNRTLRPIIKLLNDSILLLVQHHMTHFDKNFSHLSTEKKIHILQNFLEKNQKIRATLQGLIAGHMTLDELKTYFENTREFNRRILTMIEERIIDKISFFS